METVLGIKWSTLIAGFSGSVISLSYERELHILPMVLALLSGVTAAAYLTPLAALYFKLPEATENAIAFLLGLSAMNLMPGILKLSERFRDRPETLLGRKKDGDD